MLTLVPEEVEAYAVANTKPVPPLLEELRNYTLSNTSMPQMQVGPIEGNFLKVLARIIGARRIVEIGTFTGYSALMMAAGLPRDGELITCEIDESNAKIAQSFFDRSQHGKKINLILGPASETLSKIHGPFDMAFIDADKGGYIDYFEAILPMMRKGGLIVADNVLWSGKVLEGEHSKEESTKALIGFNQHISRYAEKDRVMLTVRDGMTLIVV